MRDDLDDTKQFLIGLAVSVPVGLIVYGMIWLALNL